MDFLGERTSYIANSKASLGPTKIWKTQKNSEHSLKEVTSKNSNESLEEKTLWVSTIESTFVSWLLEKWPKSSPSRCMNMSLC